MSLHQKAYVLQRMLSAKGGRQTPSHPRDQKLHALPRCPDLRLDSERPRFTHEQLSSRQSTNCLRRFSSHPSAAAPQLHCQTGTCQGTSRAARAMSNPEGNSTAAPPNSSSVWQREAGGVTLHVVVILTSTANACAKAGKTSNMEWMCFCLLVSCGFWFLSAFMAFLRETLWRVSFSSVRHGFGLAWLGLARFALAWRANAHRRKKNKALKEIFFFGAVRIWRGLAWLGFAWLCFLSQAKP